jgi:hypothetical protein
VQTNVKEIRMIFFMVRFISDPNCVKSHKCYTKCKQIRNVYDVAYSFVHKIALQEFTWVGTLGMAGTDILSSSKFVSLYFF